MSTYQEPAKIKRVGVAIELEDGRRIMMFTDDPGAEVELNSEVEEVGSYYDYSPRKIATISRELTIRNFNRYTIATTEPEHADQAIERIKKTLER